MLPESSLPPSDGVFQVTHQTIANALKHMLTVITYFVVLPGFSEPLYGKQFASGTCI